MEPRPIVSIVGTAVSLDHMVFRCISGLNLLKGNYHDAPLIISTIIDQFCAVQAVLTQLSAWNRQEHDRKPRFQQLALQIDIALDGLGLFVIFIQSQLALLDSTTAKPKLEFLWNRDDLAHYSRLLSRQVDALNLLLQAVQCETWTEQFDIIYREKSQRILKRAKDCSSEMLGLDDAESLVLESLASEDSTGASATFDFDGILLSIRRYQAAKRPHLRRSIPTEKTDLQVFQPTAISPPPQPDQQKVVLLGCSGSGKTTLLNTLLFEQEERFVYGSRHAYIQSVWHEAITSVQTILDAMDKLQIPLELEANFSHISTLSMQSTRDDIGVPLPELARAISNLWDDSGFRLAYKRRYEYQLNDNAFYYIANIRRLVAPGYIPTCEDILRTKSRTSGISSHPFKFLDGLYDVVDVGGTRTERRKWVYAYKDASTLIFTVDTTAYPKTPAEPRSYQLTEMHVQSDVFEDIANSAWSQATNFIIVFTKIDLLEEWLHTRPVEQYMDYSRPKNTAIDPVEHYMLYLEGHFMGLIKSEAVRRRTRILRTNLVDINHVNPAMKVLQVLNEVTLSYSKGDS